MAEYIEREALIDKTSDILMNGSRYRVVFFDDVILAPAADVVEVVRCRDCEYCVSDGDDGDGNKMLHCLNSSNLGWVNPTDFCSGGKRKDTTNG